MFLQVIQGAVADAGQLRQALDRWAAELAPGASGWLGITAGVTDDGTFIASVRFTSEETARRNQDRPEQGQWWTETAKLFTGEATFHDCRDVTLLGPGGSDQAKFVQVIQGHSENPQRLHELLRGFEPMMATYRPDLLGSTIGWHGDGGYTQLAYFTNEEEARRGEAQEPPPEMQALLAEDMALSGEVTYFDLRDPWLYSPPS